MRLMCALCAKASGRKTAAGNAARSTQTQPTLDFRISVKTCGVKRHPPRAERGWPSAAKNVPEVSLLDPGRFVAKACNASEELVHVCPLFLSFSIWVAFAFVALFVASVFSFFITFFLVTTLVIGIAFGIGSPT